MISVIVPIYNVGKYLRKCLDSIVNQTYTDFEVLMIDDGSKDNSSEIAQYYLKDPKFKYYHQHNQGPSAARNKGLDNAQGEYVCFIDSDDFIAPNYLEILFDTLLRNDADIAQCGVNRVWEDGRSQKIYDNRILDKTYTDISEFILSAPFSVCNKLFRIQLFADLRFPVGLKFEDFALIPQVLGRAKKISSVSASLYNYLWRETSITNQSKIQPDILKVQNLLEKSEFGINNPYIMEIFFIRQVMGSLLWTMILCNEPQTKILTIIKEGLRKYPDIRKSIDDTTIGTGKALWGKLLIDGHYNMASVYAKLYNLSYHTARSIYRFLKKS